MQDTKQQEVNSGHTLQIGDHCPVSIHNILFILSPPVDQSTVLVEDGNNVAFIEILNCSPPGYIANNYSNNTYFICSLATWGKYKGTPKVLTCSSPL